MSTFITGGKQIQAHSSCRHSRDRSKLFHRIHLGLLRARCSVLILHSYFHPNQRRNPYYLWSLMTTYSKSSFTQLPSNLRHIGHFPSQHHTHIALASMDPRSKLVTLTASIQCDLLMSYCLYFIKRMKICLYWKIAVEITSEGCHPSCGQLL